MELYLKEYFGKMLLKSQLTPLSLSSKYPLTYFVTVIVPCYPEWLLHWTWQTHQNKAERQTNWKATGKQSITYS